MYNSDIGMGGGGGGLPVDSGPLNTLENDIIAF